MWAPIATRAGRSPARARCRRGRHEPPGRADAGRGRDDGGRLRRRRGRRRRRARHRPVRRDQRSEHLHQPDAAVPAATSSSRRTSSTGSIATRPARARHIVLLRGDVPMYGDPRPFIDDPRGRQGRPLDRRPQRVAVGAPRVAAHARRDEGARRVARDRCCSLLALARAAGPPRPAHRRRVAAVRPARAARRAARAGRRRPSNGGGSNLVLACILRDQVQRLLADALGKRRAALHRARAQLVAAAVATRRAPQAGAALARVYKRLRALPSRGQAAAPWSAGPPRAPRFRALYRDVAELCRTLGAPLTEANAEAA